MEILLPSITKLVNLSLAELVFPQKFKKAVVTPLIQKASLPNEDLQNYRPVSGQCFMSKLVERVVVRQLMQHINSNNLDNPRQFAYKSGPCSKMRSISHYHWASLLHWSYWICWLHSIIIIMYLYSVQYLHILQDSKPYLTNPDNPLTER